MADPKLTHRPAMFPFLAEYTADDGTKSGGWAVPSMITEPLGALGRLLNTPAGTMPDPQNPQNQTDMLTALMALYGGNAMKGMAKGSGAAKAAARADMETPRAVSYGNMIDDALSNPALLRQMDDIKHAQLNEQARALYGRGIDELTGSQEAQLRGWSDPALWSDTGKPNPVGAGVAGNGGHFKARAYHGSDRGFERFKEPDDGGLYSELDVPHEGVWFANDPARSEYFANKAARMGERRGDAGSTGPAIYPADIEFKNPYFHPPEMFADEGISSLPSEFELRKLGHDGAVIDRARWDYTPDGGLKLTSEGIDYQALQPGTVRSPLTGELLFSDTGKPSLLGSALTAIQNPDNRPEWMKQLDALKGWGT